jgi:uncharacterized membrane protein (UPF0127 family)
VVWIAADGSAVDARLADPWKIYLPSAAARFTLEALPETLERVSVGDVLEFVDESP